jgi:hypothetical protein
MLNINVGLFNKTLLESLVLQKFDVKHQLGLFNKTLLEISKNSVRVLYP